MSRPPCLDSKSEPVPIDECGHAACRAEWSVFIRHRLVELTAEARADRRPFPVREPAAKHRSRERRRLAAELHQIERESAELTKEAP